MTYHKERAASYTCIEPAGQMMREVIDKLERLEADHRDLRAAHGTARAQLDELDRIVNRQVGQTLAEAVTALVRRAKKGERLEKKEGR
jgi:hypothetical protein